MAMLSLLSLLSVLSACVSRDADSGADTDDAKGDADSGTDSASGEETGSGELFALDVVNDTEVALSLLGLVGEDSILLDAVVHRLEPGQSLDFPVTAVGPWYAVATDVDDGCYVSSVADVTGDGARPQAVLGTLDASGDACSEFSELDPNR